MAVREVSSHRSFGGTVKVFEHDSYATQTPMKFSVFLPSKEPRPVAIYYLAGLMGDHLRFFEKTSSALETASRLGLAFVTPDNSPRNLTFPEFNQKYSYGNAAGMYINATLPPFAANFQMHTYVTQELPAVINANFSFDERQGLMGHSMGGHGALLIGLTQAVPFKTIAALSPITNTLVNEWTIDAFTRYLGPDKEVWKQYDSTELVKSGVGKHVSIRVDYGSLDEYSDLLKCDEFEAVCKANGYENISFHCHEGFDHGYFFISSVIEEVLKDQYQRLTRE